MRHGDDHRTGLSVHWGLVTEQAGVVVKAMNGRGEAGNDFTGMGPLQWLCRVARGLIRSACFQIDSQARQDVRRQNRIEWER